MPLGGAALIAAREVQVPILAFLLIGACAAKARRAAATRSVGAPISPTAIFPVRLRRPATLGLCATELGLGTGLIVTAGQVGTSTPAVTIRAAAALLFAVAVAALNEVRISRPGAGCGCFGDLSDTPVSMRSLVRSALLCLGAIASIGVPPLRLPASASQSLLLMAVATAELTLLAALSPEVGKILVRLGYSEPCEALRLPVSRTLASLHGSAAWRYYRPYLATPGPSDIWREGCWRFMTYPGEVDNRRVDVVFAVYLQSRRPPVRAAIVDAVEERALVFLPPATVTSSAAATAAEALASNRQHAPTFSPRRTARQHHPATPAPDQGMPRRPRFTPHREPGRHALHDRQRSSSGWPSAGI